MLVDGDQLYYLDVASAFSGLYRIPTSGGTPTLVDGVLDIQDDGSGQDFALDDRAAYVTYNVLDDSSPNRNQVTIVDKATLSRRSVAATAYGCTVPVIAQLGAWAGTAWLGQHNDVRASSGCAPFDSIEVLTAGADTSTSVNRLASGSLALLVDGTHVFWSNGGAVFRELHDGSMMEQLAPIAAERLVTDGNALFASVGAHVYAITAPGQYKEIYANTAQSWYTVNSIAVDDARVYVSGPWGVVSFDKNGADVRTVVTDDAGAVAVDATNVYYFANDDVMTVCK